MDNRRYPRTSPHLLHRSAIDRRRLDRPATSKTQLRAEVASNVHGAGGAPLPAAPVTAPVSAQLPPSARGSNEGAPPGWSLVEPFLGMIWPDGSPGKLRAAAEAWTTAGSAFLASEA